MFKYSELLFKPAILLTAYSFTVSHCSNVGTNIPLIDVSCFFQTPRDDRSVLNASIWIDRALRSDGVFLVFSNEWPAFDKKFQAAASLFSLPIEEKLDVSLGTSSWLRGYLKHGSESGLDSVFEPKEGFAYGFNWDSIVDNTKVNEMQVDNIWPKTLEEKDKYILDESFSSNVALAEGLSEVIFQSLRTEFGDYSLRGFEEGGERISLMRLFHYFPANSTSAPIDRQILGSSPHTDWGYLTLILQDDCGGLQFLRDNTWIDVPAVPGTIVVNAGDYLQLLSNGKYHSPIHRVVSPITRERLSFVFFYYPGFDSIIHAGTGSLEETEVSVLAEEQYNTLLSTSNIDAVKGLRFGPYIVHKWREVLRL